MLTRRQFLKWMATLSASAVATACARALPTQTPVPPMLTPTATSSSTVTATATATATSTATALPTATATATATPTATLRGLDLVTVRGDQFYYHGVRFPINGFNYYPRLHPWRTFNLGEWDARGAERELQLAVSLGANVVRIFVDYNFSLDTQGKTPLPTPTFFAPLAQYVKNVREFLDLAGKLGLQVIITLFDSLDWAMYLPQNYWIAEEYLKRIVPPFVNDPRVLCWDLQNEPDRALALVGNANVIPFFQRLALLTRALDPNHLRTIGWIDRARAKYFPVLDDVMDFWCFHYYDSADKLDDLVKFYKTQTKKPVLLEEFGLPSGGPGYATLDPEQDQVTHYRKVLTTLQDNQMCGSVLWCLNDFPIGLAGNPPLKTDSPENHFRVFRLDYSEKPVASLLRSFWRPVKTRKPE